MSIMLVSVDEVKDFLELSLTNHTYDSLLGSIIKYVSDRIQIYLNRNLKLEQRTEYFQAGKRRYYLSSFPIDSSATITVVVDDTTKTVNDEYYVWHSDGLIEFDYSPSYVEPKQIYVTYSGGYEVTTTTIGDSTYTNLLLDVPDSIKYACMIQTVYIFKRRKDIGLSSVSMPDGSIQSSGTAKLLPEVIDILKSYRKSASVR